MSKLRILLKEWLKKLLSDSHSAIVGALIGLLFAGSYISLDSVRIGVNNALKSPTQLWAAIALAVIVIVYIYLKFRSYVIPKSKRYLINSNGWKWMVKEYSDGKFDVSYSPYCKTHNSPMIKTPANQYMCGEMIGSKCNSKIMDEDSLNLYYQIAFSKAESKIRNYKTKC